MTTDDALQLILDERDRRHETDRLRLVDAAEVTRKT